MIGPQIELGINLSINFALRLDFRDANPSDPEPANIEWISAALVVQNAAAGVATPNIRSLHLGHAYVAGQRFTLETERPARVAAGGEAQRYHGPESHKWHPLTVACVDC